MELALDGLGTLQAQLIRALREHIASGALRSGDAIPGSRVLATELGLSRTTILYAVEQLISEGILETRPGAGTFVGPLVGKHSLRDSAEMVRKFHPRLSRVGRRLTKELRAIAVSTERSESLLPFDFRYSVGRADDFPLAAWRRALGSAARNIDSWGFRYPPIEGSSSLRHVLANYLGRVRGLRVTARDLLIVGGSQQGLDLAVRVLLNPGESVALENPHYPGARVAFRASGAKIIPIRADVDGLDTSRLEGLRETIRLVHVTPSHQFPLGGVMSRERRLALLAWARKKNAVVIEDDYNSEFRLAGGPVEPLANLDHEGRVLYLGTFSKVLMPSLRLGFMIVPDSLREAFLAAKVAMDQGRALLEQEALSLFIQDGDFERHVRRVRRRQRERRTILLEEIERHMSGTVVVHGASGGLHVVLELKNHTPGEISDVVRRAASKGVGVVNLASHFHGRPRFAGLLLGTSALDGPEISRGIRLLGEALGEV